jgi:uncharacterized protein (DUF302 family)
MNSELEVERIDGVIRVRSRHSARETVANLLSELERRGLRLFSHIKFSDDAEKAGLRMPFTEMLIFGNPKAGTPVMLFAPGAALDLPLKILVAADAQDDVWLSSNDPLTLQHRYSLPPELTAKIGGAEGLMRAAAE